MKMRGFIKGNYPEDKKLVILLLFPVCVYFELLSKQL